MTLLSKFDAADLIHHDDCIECGQGAAEHIEVAVVRVESDQPHVLTTVIGHGVYNESLNLVCKVVVR